MFRCGWMWNCWNLFSNLHQSTRILQMRLHWRLPKGPFNIKSLSCLYHGLTLIYFACLGPSNRAVQGRRGETESYFCSQDRHAKARFGQVRKFNWVKLPYFFVLQRLNMEPILNESTRSSCALDYDFKSGSLFWFVTTFFLKLFFQTFFSETFFQTFFQKRHPILVCYNFNFDTIF